MRIVGPGTPAAAAGFEPGDVITAVGAARIRTAPELLAALKKTEPGQTVEFTVERAGDEQKLSATLGHQPLDVIRPEFETEAVQIVKPKNHDPLSFLTTIAQFDDRSLSNDDKELGGVNLRLGTWEVVQATDKLVQFRRQIPLLGLEFTKTYRLANVPEDEQDNVTYPAYNLLLDISVANVGDKNHKVAYRLDGPTGLPIEGAWYANKVSRNWGSAGLRDVIAVFEGGGMDQISPGELAKEDFKKDWGASKSLDYIAVDAQYFSVALIPQKKDPTQILFQSIMPIRAGKKPEEAGLVRLMNVSFRLDSTTADLAPGGARWSTTSRSSPDRSAPPCSRSTGSPADRSRTWSTTAGLASWPAMLSEVLHFFHSIIGNYGVAIIMLTVVVRGCMFPLSRKQALGAQKMQDLAARDEAHQREVQERRRKEDQGHAGAVSPAQLQSGGRLPAGVRAVADLRRPVPFADGRCRTAPGAAVDRRRFAGPRTWPRPTCSGTGPASMPDFITSGTGFFGLGPYLNLLPLVTIALFIWQQKMFMPPAADEQAAMQQKMMQYMMIFMGVLFFKVASGLCLYFIASSLWGVCERKLLPKLQKKTDSGAAEGTPAVARASSGGNGAPAGKKKQRGRK